MKLENKTAFTLVDLLLVMGLVLIAFSFSAVNLLGLQNKPTLSAAVQKLLVDLKSQQTRAMVGDSAGGLSSYAWGVYIEPTGYTLFRGTVYSVSDSHNFVVEDSNISLSTSFVGNTIVFNKRSGEIDNFSAGADSITITNIASGESKTITLNSLGVASIN